MELFNVPMPVVHRTEKDWGDGLWIGIDVIKKNMMNDKNEPVLVRSVVNLICWENLRSPSPMYIDPNDTEIDFEAINAEQDEYETPTEKIKEEDFTDETILDETPLETPETEDTVIGNETLETSSQE